MKKILVAAAILAMAMMAFKPGPGKPGIYAKQKNEGSHSAPTKWTFDKAHTNVIFSVSHLVISEVEGRFDTFDGYMESSKEDYSDAKIVFSIDVNSIDTHDENRDKHLKSDDFFNAATYPQIKFESTSFTPGFNNDYTLKGNLTIRDVTKPVSLEVHYGGSVNMMGNTHIGFKAKTKIDRFDYNLKWDKATEAGGMVVGKEVTITLNIDLKKS